MTDRHMKICSASLIGRKMQIKTKSEILPHSGYKRQDISSVKEVVEVKEPSHTVTGTATGGSLCTATRPSAAAH